MKNLPLGETFIKHVFNRKGQVFKAIRERQALLV